MNADKCVGCSNTVKSKAVVKQDMVGELTILRIE